jgi:flagellar motility protein MotE (MotC chaperone)
MNAFKRWTAYLLLSLLIAAGAFVGVSYIPSGHPEQAWAADEDEEKPEEEAAEGETAEGEDGEAPCPECPECPECPDPAKVVLQGLEEKKKAVAEASDTLAKEKKELETYEAQIDEKLESLTALKKQIEADMARLEEKKTAKEQQEAAAFETKMNRLVKMYASMKPKAAAEIVNKMELSVAYEIFLRMREVSASQILAFVESEKAAKISERLAFRKR